MTKENRICYFGTRGQAGHTAHPIVGNFTKEELDNIEKIDHPVYHEAMNADGFIYCTLGNFMFYAIPCSKDDKRPGCITAIFVEFAKNSNDIREAIKSDSELRWRFSKRLPKENEIYSDRTMPSIRKTKKRLKRGISNLQWEMAYYKPRNFTLNGEPLYDIVQQWIGNLEQELQQLKRKK